MRFKVDNMTCGHCVRTITAVLKAVDPQAVVSIDLPSRMVEVEGALTAEQAIAAMASEDYTAVQQ